MPAGETFDLLVPSAGIDDEPARSIHFRAKRVASSNIDWIAWPKSRNEPLMLVQFRGGTRYAYLGVSRQKAIATANAKSSGHYLNERIKPHYKVVQIR